MMQMILPIKALREIASLLYEWSEQLCRSLFQPPRYSYQYARKKRNSTSREFGKASLLVLERLKDRFIFLPLEL